MTRLCHLLSLRERIHQYKEHMVNLYVGGNCKYLAADMSFFPKCQHALHCLGHLPQNLPIVGVLGWLNWDTIVSLSSVCLKWESLAVRFSVDILYRMALLSWTMAHLVPRWKAASTANANGQSTSKSSQCDSLIVTWLCNVLSPFLFLFFQRCHIMS